MKAARIHAFGGSEKVRVETVPLLPLGQVRRALDMNEKGRSHGKIVLDLT